MTDDQIKILRHLAGVMSDQVEGDMMRFRPPPTPEELEDARFMPVQFHQIGVDWNPFESAEDALGLLRATGLNWRIWNDAGDVHVEVEDADANDHECYGPEVDGIGNPATLACYRATGGTDV